MSVSPLDVGRRVAERVAVLEVAGDAVEASREVAGVDDRPAAGAIGQAQQRLLEIGGARELDAVGEAEVRGVHAADACAGGGDAVKGDAVGVGEGGELVESPGKIVLVGLEGGVRGIGASWVAIQFDVDEGRLVGDTPPPAPIVEPLLERPEQILGRPHGQTVADVEDGLAPRQARHRPDGVLQVDDRGVDLASDHCGEVADQLHRRAVAGRNLVVSVEFAQDVEALRFDAVAAADDPRDLPGRLGDAPRLGREGKRDLEPARIVDGEHRPVVRAELDAQEVAQERQQPVAVRRRQVVVVDVDHQAQPVLRRRRFGRDEAVEVALPGPAVPEGGGLPFARARVQAVRELEEVRELHRATVLPHLEVVCREAGHRVAVAVGHPDVDVDDADVDRLAEGLGRGFLLCLGGAVQQAQQAERGEGRRTLHPRQSVSPGCAGLRPLGARVF